MELRKVNPYNVGVSEYNERRNLDMDSNDELVTNIEEVGELLQKPIVTETTDDDAQYKAVVGQRRVTASQIADIDDIGVMVVDWDAEESLVATITENFEEFNQAVNPRDRAYALYQLWREIAPEGQEDQEPDLDMLANRLGTAKSTISRWKELLREQWEETEFDPREENVVERVQEEADEFDNDDEETEETTETVEKEEPKEDTDSVMENLSASLLREARIATDDGEEAVGLARKFSEYNFTRDEAKKAKRLIDEGYGIDEAIGIVIDGEYESAISDEDKTEDSTVETNTDDQENVKETGTMVEDEEVTEEQTNSDRSVVSIDTENIDAFDVAVSASGETPQEFVENAVESRAKEIAD